MSWYTQSIMVNRNSSQAVRLNELDTVLLRTKSTLLVSFFSHNVKLTDYPVEDETLQRNEHCPHYKKRFRDSS